MKSQQDGGVAGSRKSDLRMDILPVLERIALPLTGQVPCLAVFFHLPLSLGIQMAIVMRSTFA